MTQAKHHDETQDHGRLREGYDAAAETATRVFDKATQALGTSREAASDAAHKAVKGLETNPLGILVGGLAVGAIAGALLPRSEREKALLAPLGARIGETARAATLAAKEAGKGELDSLGLSREAARGQAKSLFEGVVQALSTAGAAAAKSATQKAQG